MQVDIKTGRQVERQTFSQVEIQTVTLRQVYFYTSITFLNTSISRTHCLESGQQSAYYLSYPDPTVKL